MKEKEYILTQLIFDSTKLKSTTVSNVQDNIKDIIMDNIKDIIVDNIKEKIKEREKTIKRQLQG